MKEQISNAARLRALMQRHKLTYAKVAELAGVSIKTVEGWMATPGAGHYRNMPTRAIELIELKLKSGGRQGSA